MLSRAISIASTAFEGMYDKSGEPYIMHCLKVMYDVRYKSEKYKIVAVLHDLIEDTSWTLEDLRVQGFDEEILEALDALTHRKGESYDDYIGRIAKNIIATRVKLGDLRHNSDILRLKGVEPKDFARIEKYHKAFVRLQFAYKKLKESRN